MLFPWARYEEIPSIRKNTLQIFITNRCNLNCYGCFARKIMKKKIDISLSEYKKILLNFLEKGGKQINLIGGEPLLHPDLREILQLNRLYRIKTTIYTNGYFLNNYTSTDFKDVKIRISLYCKNGKLKSLRQLPKTDKPIEICYMISKKTTVNELIECANYIEKEYNCNIFFISSLRELDNPSHEFFEDTSLTMNVLEYKRVVHDFLNSYNGRMEIHISKRGVFESTKTLAGNRCKFANYFIGGKIIQCPYDIINLKFQKDYCFDSRNCQHNNSCLMSKIILRRR